MDGDEAQDAINHNLLQAFVLVQTGFFVACVLFVSPLIVKWFRSGRYRQGWHLTRNLRPRTSPQSRHSLANFPETSPDPPLTVTSPIIGPLFVAYRNFYNKCLLPTVPYVELTIGQLVILALYSGLSVFVATYKVQSWSENPTRFGHVALAQLPATVFLAMKNSPLAIFGKGYEKLNFLHRFAGRLMVLFAVVHGSFYYNAQMKRSGHITLEGHIKTGTIQLTAISSMFILGLRPIRRMMYQVFLWLHIAGYITLIVSLWFHVGDHRPYVIVAIVGVVFDHLCKLAKTRVRAATITSLPGGLTKIEVSRLGDGWRAGQHVSVRVFQGGKFLEKHPFTIANAPATDSVKSTSRKLVIVAKEAGDYTRRLHHINSSDAQSIVDSEKQSVNTSDAHLPVSIEGPYGGMGYTDMRDFESVLLIAGGSGFTYCNAMLEDIVGSKMKGKAVTSHVLVIWTLRDLAMVKAFAVSIERALDRARDIGLDVSFRIHVTQPLGHNNYCPVPSAQIVQARPNIPYVLGELVDLTVGDVEDRRETRGAGVGVGVCGPLPLVVTTRQAVSACPSKSASKAGGIVIHSETFGW